MQKTFAALLAFGTTVTTQAADAPIAKVLSMVSDLQAKIVKEGETVQKEYAEYAEWCEDRSRDLGHEIVTGKAEGNRLQAEIAEDDALLGKLAAKIDELASEISVNEADLKAATDIRRHEAADFAAEEKDLVETADMLTRATAILERQSGGASMVQFNNAGGLAQAFEALVQASMISTGDVAKLTAFAQLSEKDEDEAPGAPAGAVYTSQSGGIIDTLHDLNDKAESQLSELRNKEVSNRGNFEMLKQSLTDELAYGNKEMTEAKDGVAGGSERKASAEGDLAVSSKELTEDVKAKASLHQACMEKATAFEAETQSRGEELAALAQAKSIIKEATSAAALDQVSFVQRALLTTGRDLHEYEVVRFVRDLAHTQHSGALVQLASKMATAIQSKDAFAKIKGLIGDMIARLESEAEADATKKAFCDKELAESNQKKSDKTDEIKKLSNKIGQMSAKSAQLKEEVAALQSELAKLAKSQAEMDRMRQEEKAAFADSSAELDKGLTGIKAALKLLNEYYGGDSAHGAAQGAGGGIISLLEVCEADFSKNLAQVTADEEAAIAEYEQVTKENEIETTTKNQDVHYKSKESKELDKTSAELGGDRSEVQTELDAVQEYLTGIEAQCIAKAESYATRKERREAEIAGLKEALQILESETALVQGRTARRTLRAGFLHVSS